MAVFTYNFLTIGLNKLLGTCTSKTHLKLICLQVSGYTKPAVEILNVLL